MTDSDAHDSLAEGPLEIEPGCIAVMFISGRSDDDKAGYEAAATEMFEAVANAPGYLGYESVSSPDGRGITISFWRDEQSVAAWRSHQRHTEVRAEGRKTWYDWYRLVVAKVTRAYDWGGPGGS